MVVVSTYQPVRVLPFAPFEALAFSHLALTAFRALSLRSSAVMLAALAGPPFSPPLRPKATAYGFFFLVCGMVGVYVTALENKSIIFLDLA